MFVTRKYLEEELASLVDSINFSIDTNQDWVDAALVKVRKRENENLSQVTETILSASAVIANLTKTATIHRANINELRETVAELYAIVDDLQLQVDGKAKPVPAKKAAAKPVLAAETDIRDKYPAPAKKAVAPLSGSRNITSTKTPKKA